MTSIGVSTSPGPKDGDCHKLESIHFGWPLCEPSSRHIGASMLNCLTFSFAFMILSTEDVSQPPRSLDLMFFKALCRHVTSSPC
mmetsp:Transcript_62807/g.168278  ORF Transcript_62807/g.168278 Transcript_62807/m.168278 type:complete len:84 (+) Transcript_62807:218-469(+)